MNKLLFIGNERLGTGLGTNAPVLRALIAAGYEITAVIANHIDPVSRQGRDLEIGRVAKENDIPVLLPGHKIPLIEKVRKHPAEAAILVAFGQIVPQEVIDFFPAGIINLHPSMLPKHRGPTPIESVILNGEKETGVSLMQLSSKMDAGPVYAQKNIKLSGKETKQELADSLAEAGSDLLVNNLQQIISGELKPKPQDDSLATYDELIRKQDGVLDFNKDAAQLERQILAYAGWPKSRANIGKLEVIITKAHAVPVNNPGFKPGDVRIDQGKILTIECGKGYLYVERIQPLNKKEMPVEAFLAGYKDSI